MTPEAGSFHSTRSTLRAAFLSGLVLELVAMLGTALVAVFGGVRLAGGHADHLDRGVGEHHAGHHEERAVPVVVAGVRPEPTRVAPEVVEPGLVAADAEAADHHHDEGVDQHRGALPG